MVDILTFAARESRQTRRASLTSMQPPCLYCLVHRRPCRTNTWADQRFDECRFILNGLRHANRVLGEAAFDEKEWRVVGEYVYDAEGGRHQAFYSPLRETTVMGDLIRPHERIQVEQSLKYSPAEAKELWKRAGMTEIGQWRCRDEYGQYDAFHRTFPAASDANFSPLWLVLPPSLFRRPIMFRNEYPTFPNSAVHGTSHTMPGRGEHVPSVSSLACCWYPACGACIFPTPLGERFIICVVGTSF